MAMQHCTLALAVAVSCWTSTTSRVLHVQGSTPITKVVELLTELKGTIEEDGKSEQQSYDKYACWCENTMERKAKDISDAKIKLEELGNLILKLSSDLAAEKAEIAQLKKDISANLEAQKEATAVREKEYSDYESEKTESEQCIGALESAIKVLSGAGTGKKAGFLETFREAQVFSAAAGVRGVLNKAPEHDALESVSDSDMQLVKHFVSKPQDFFPTHASTLSAVQISGNQNPFGDYAPQSTQIQGVLKGMYDAFAGGLEKDNAEESEKQKSFEEFMATKKEEEESLKATLQTKELSAAENTKSLADSKVERQDTTEQLASDEDFFDTTKKGCSEKSTEWAGVTERRTQELQGIMEAIHILSNEDASKTFSSAYTTLVQTAASTQKSHSHSDRSAAFSHLTSLAKKYQSANMAKLAAEVKTTGHFDKVMYMIDEMIKELREEDADDIAHRDRCENAMNMNSNDLEDLGAGMTKSKEKLQRMNNTKAELEQDVAAVEDAMKSTKTDQAELLEMRNEEVAKFRQALKDDTDAIELIEKAIVALSKFYKDNKIPLELMQKKQSEPEYTVDPDKAPETTFGGDYKGRQGESGGIISILEMLTEDLRNEIKEGRADDEEAQKDYLKNSKALTGSLEASRKSKVALDKQLAELGYNIVDAEEERGQLNEDEKAQNDLADALVLDCTWVKKQFDIRREKRKNELAGLQDAKNFLAGAE